MPASLSTFHEGETAMRDMLKVPRGRNPTSPGLPMPYAMRVRQSPLVAMGTLDSQGRPWTTIWGGERGFAGPVAQGVLGFNSEVDMRHDPVFEALWAEAGSDGIVRPNGGEGKMMSALSIDLETRDRVKLAGVMVAGAVVKKDDGREPVGSVQAAMVVTESLGNCPKYLNKKDVVPHDPSAAELVSDALPLPRDAVGLVYKADMFFLSTTAEDTMDTNHRGGAPGFVRVLRNDEGGVELVYPEFSGNRLYQSLGNLKVNPAIGIAIPDYDTADVLYLTGRASILVGEAASSLIARTQLAVRVTVSAARFVRAGLPFRGAPGEFSPYNPPVRQLLLEKNDPRSVEAATDMTATLVRRELLTPTIAKFTFKLSPARGETLPAWKAGQHVTLSFEDELGFGYAHMRDEDPQSINDDFIRTFTVSSTPGWRTNEFQITARRHGPATGLLWRHNLRAALDLPVLGFGGEDRFRMPATAAGQRAVFIAGGVGVTPLLAQARAVLDSGVDLEVLWSLRAEDLPLARDAFEQIQGLAGVTKLFVTGQNGEAEGGERVAGVKELRERRMGSDDVTGLKGDGRKFYVCAGPELLRKVNGWLGGEDVVWEDFGY